MTTTRSDLPEMREPSEGDPTDVPPESEPTAGAADAATGVSGDIAGNAGSTATQTVEVAKPGSGGAVSALLFWVAVGLVIALSNDTSRQWISDNWKWFSVVAAAAVAVAVVALLGIWAKSKSTQLRAAVYLLVVFPAVALGTAGIFWMPTAGQLVALRGVVLCVLVFTPALMWWLFLATQRASLLNEFVASLDRLGLLTANRIGADKTESDAARETRVSSYLQKFEATYGGLPEHIRDDVVEGEFRSYSSEETRAGTSLTAAAVPVTLSLVTLLVGWILVLPPIDTFPDDPTTNPRWLLALSPNATPVTFAFLGAYFFSMQMLFRRYVRGDLRGSAYVAVVLRVVLAVVGIWVVQGIGDEAGWTTQSQLLTLAFVIGVFPVVVWQVLSGAASKAFHLVLPALKSRMPLNELDGLTVWHESRLEEEDIENVQNMATAEIVDLLVNTRIPVPRIIDWIDQAILLTQLGPNDDGDKSRPTARGLLARHGVRSASALLQTAADKSGDERKVFEKVLVDAAGNPAIPSLLSSIRTNDNLARVLRWRGLESLLASG
jgi:hypothetical protein